MKVKVNPRYRPEVNAQIVSKLDAIAFRRAAIAWIGGTMALWATLKQWGFLALALGTVANLVICLAFYLAHSHNLCENWRQFNGIYPPTPKPRRRIPVVSMGKTEFLDMPDGAGGGEL